ncbi:redoxin domain-containing protein [Virgibacillus sp. C22-A2]|uniref:Redoxin domain-containing protein n=1 Tax=Virgibacillus tibetensis TaxID=3042313 RepID=A0ABU6KBS8_9BACI|nr:redoxin domain-containing protein [Virgibacillus sp. C22-A2]
MYKQLIGMAILLVLAGIVLVNFVQQNSESNNSSEYNSSGDINTEGGAIAPAESSGIQPGEVAPDFELETIDGTIVKLSDYRGKKVILNFWATWCGPCREEMPEMQDFYDEHGESVEILAVNLTGTEMKENDVHNYIDEYNYTYPILLDRSLKVSDEYRGGIAVPTTYFIGTEGTIQQPRKVGVMTYEFMEDMVNSLN